MVAGLGQKQPEIFPKPPFSNDVECRLLPDNTNQVAGSFVQAEGRIGSVYLSNFSVANGSRDGKPR
ncbi:MAG: hypothetical protein WB952_21745 [Terriglobales bacterium]